MTAKDPTPPPRDGGYRGLPPSPPPPTGRIDKVDPVAREVEYIVQRKLEEFARSGQTGMITIDVQISQGKPTAINAATKENRKLSS